jgi:hypothetical protein
MELTPHYIRHIDYCITCDLDYCDICRVEDPKTDLQYIIIKGSTNDKNLDWPKHCLKHLNNISKPQICNICNRNAKLNKEPNICNGCYTKLISNTEKLYKSISYDNIIEDSYASA